MSKRRRSVTSTDSKDDDEAPTTVVSPMASPTSLKRRKKSTNDEGDLIQEVYDALRNHKNEEGRLLCEAFIRAPKRRSLPEYYEIVTNPMDLLKIQQRIKMEEYNSISDMVGDVDIMVKNAQAFYKKTTQEYKDASELWEVLQKAVVSGGQSWETVLTNKPAKFLTPEISPKIKIAESPKSPIVLLRRQECSWECKPPVPDGTDDLDTKEPEDKQPLKEDGVLVVEHNFEDPTDPLEHLFTSVYLHRDGRDKRLVSRLFRKLPLKSQFPAYYDVISEPIDLKDVAKKLKGGQYAALDDLEKDLLLMVSNAKTFNEPGSQVYKDANAIKKVAIAQKILLETKGLPPTRPGEGPSALSEALALPSDDEDEDSEEEKEEGEEKEEIEDNEDGDDAIVEEEEEEREQEEEEEEQEADSMEYEDPEESGNESLLSDTSNDNNLNQIFGSVVNFKNAAGQVISEPFMRLPSRRTYPDYYQEIKAPMALCKIRGNIKGGKYESLQEMVAEMDLVFTNAKQYNMPNSRLYKDADRLQKIMHTKVKEVDSIKKEYESDDESGSRKKKAKRDAIRTNMMTLYQTLIDCKDETGRGLIPMFMEKPSKKEYPDYYQVITDPVDMKSIEVNILTDKYPSEETLLVDFDTMFCNARHYNEEGSVIFEDANHLEKALKKKCKDMNIPIPDFQMVKGVRKSPKKNNKALSPLAQKLQELYTTIKDFKDATGRELAQPFIRLPSKNEYPEYYQIIKRPIDMQRIQQRIISKQYEQLDDMVNDFLLMFDNACKFNEPDSLIYKDALTLQRVLLQTRTELSGDETSGVPDVQGIIREILTNLLVSLANHQDEEGRCFSDSLAEVTVEKAEKDSQPETPQNSQRKPVDLDMVRHYLDKGCYKRLDIFQDHIFDVFDRARGLSRTDSQVFEDALELQKFFITIRDEICKNGEILLSPALSYTERHMQNDIDAQKALKMPLEQKEDAEKKDEDGKVAAAPQQTTGEAGETKDEDVSDGLVIQGKTYRVGDFVYVEPSEKQLKPHIVCIEKLWRDNDGEGWLHGNWFLRPNETFHLATRKFLEKEVFKSDYYNKVKISQHVIGHCFVMFVRDYFKMKPEGFTNDDVYVCESRYSAKAKAFKKIKIFSVPLNNHKIVNRNEPLSKVRVSSVFAGQRKLNELLDSEQYQPFDKAREGKLNKFIARLCQRELDKLVYPEQFQLIDGVRKDVEIEKDAEEEASTNVYYEQINYQGRCYKLGDALYVSIPDRKRPIVTRMDKIWKDTVSGDYFFSGNTFLRPSEVEHPPTRMFYKNEVFLSSNDDEVFAFKAILRKCAVLAFKDYLISRPTEFKESDVYICESQYKEQEQLLRKIKSLKKYSVANKVIDDEIYFFKKPITPLKEPSPLLQPELDEDEDMMMDDDGDDHLVRELAVSTPRGPKQKNRSASGFILFASEIRAQVRDANPNKSFGEISRLCGLEWHKLTAEDKVRYEERAAILAESRPTPSRPPPKKGNESPAPQPQPPPPGMYTIFECMWEHCDYQYDTTDDLIHHILETSGHLGGETEFPCRWKGCVRFKKNQPFPIFSRLVRHCKEVHVKNSVKHLYPHQLSRNYFPRHFHQTGMTQHPGGAVMGIVGPPTPVGMATQQLTQPNTQYQGNYNQGMQDMSGGQQQPYQQMPPYSQQQQYPQQQYPQHPGGMQGPPQQHMQPGPQQHLAPGPNQMHQGPQPMQGGPQQMQHQQGHMQQGPGPQHMPGGSQQQHMQGGPQYMQGGPQYMGPGHQPPQGMHPQAMLHPPPMHLGHPSAHHHPHHMLPPGVMHPQGPHMHPGVHHMAQAPPPPPQPMFVTPPAKTQRLLHSEAYIRYIEGLNSNTDSVSGWRRSLAAKEETSELTDQQKARLPSHWFANKPKDVVKAMWKLRDLLMQDTLRMAPHVDLSESEAEKAPTPEVIEVAPVQQTS